MKKEFDDKMTPLYIQIKHFIQEQYINNLEHGDKIPTELELIEQFNVSRITIRKAVNELIQEKLLIKKQGKGTFIIRPKIEKKIVFNNQKNNPISFTELFTSKGYTVSSKNLSLKVEIPNEEISSNLSLSDKDKVIVIERIRYIDGIPMLFERNNLSYEKNRFIMNCKLDELDSIYKILRQNNVEPSCILRWSFEADIAKDIGNLLSIRYGEPLLIYKTLISDKNFIPIHFSEEYFIASKFKFVLE